MAYFTLLWKARIIEQYRLNYEMEKLNSIRLSNRQNPKRTFYEKWRTYNLNTRKRLSKAFLRHYPKGSAVNNFFYYLRTDQTFPNFLLKSVIGFVGGIILTYLCFMFFVFQLSISLIHATIMSSVIGILLTLGLAFSYRIRCLVFLLLPQFFSRIGRYTLTCYALVLILTGPATNTLKNSEVLSESLACGQEQIKTDMRQINDSMQKPFDAMRDSLRPVINSLKLLANKITTISVRIQRLALSIATCLQSSYTWLRSTVDSCNQKLGTPHKLCKDAVVTAVVDCQATFGPRFNNICNAVKLTDIFCRPFVHLTAFCHMIEFFNGNVLGIVDNKLKTFSARIKSLVQMEINVHHSYTFSSNSSKSASAAYAGIVTEIRNRADPLLTWLSLSSCVTSLSLLLIIFRAKHYQHMFETRSSFDNRYVTKELRALDLKRLRQEKDVILPLNRREEQKYINTTSFRLVSSEKIHISRSAVAMAITTFKLTIHMVADYSLYWVLMTIRYYGRMENSMPPPAPDAGVTIAGSGLISKIFKSLIGSLSLPLTAKSPSPITCLPNPHPPDLQRYTQIGILIFLLWFFALFEPYGLRLRHVIMGLYRSERAKARAVWLYNHIQKTRGSFMKFARRKLHREYKYISEEKYTFRSWLNSHIPCLWLRDFLRISPDEPHCFLCGVIEPCNKCDGTLKRCDTPNCPGTYCYKCFSDIGQLCTICLSPADYGDLSDVSLEKGSSEDSVSEDSSDDEPSSLGLCLGESAQSQYRAMEEGRNLPNKNNDGMSKRTFYSKRKRNDPNDNVFVKPTEKSELKFRKDGKITKKIIERYKKYTDFDLEERKTKEILTVGQDTCPINYSCYNYWRFYRNDVVYVINSQFDRVLDMPLKNIINHAAYKELDKEKVEVKRRNAGEEKKDRQNTSFLRRSRKKRRVKSGQFMKNLLQHLKNLKIKRANRKPNVVNRSAKNRSKLKKLLSSSRTRRTRSRKRKKKDYTPRVSQCRGNTAVSINDSNIAEKSRTDVKENRYKAYLRKYQSKRKKSKQLHTVKNRIVTLMFNQRHRTLAREYNDNNDSRNTQDTGTSKLRQDFHSAENFIDLNTNNNNINKSNSEDCKTGKTKDKKGTKCDENKKFTSKTGMGKLCSLYSDLWKNAKVSFPNIQIVNFFKRDDVSVDYKRTNHKRRKKAVCSNDESHLHKDRTDNEAIRKYRISSYLSEQDWIKCRCLKFGGKSGNKLTNLREESESVEMGNLKPSPGEVVKDTQKKGQGCNKKHNDDVKIMVAEKCGFTLMKLQSDHTTQPREYVKSYKQKPTYSAEKSAEKGENIPENCGIKLNDKISAYSAQSFERDMPKSFQYFRAAGNRDFDDVAKNQQMEECLGHIFPTPSLPKPGKVSIVEPNCTNKTIAPCCEKTSVEEIPCSGSRTGFKQVASVLPRVVSPCQIQKEPEDCCVEEPIVLEDCCEEPVPLFPCNTKKCKKTICQKLFPCCTKKKKKKIYGSLVEDRSCHDCPKKTLPCKVICECNKELCRRLKNPIKCKCKEEMAKRILHPAKCKCREELCNRIKNPVYCKCCETMLERKLKPVICQCKQAMCERILNPCAFEEEIKTVNKKPEIICPCQKTTEEISIPDCKCDEVICEEILDCCDCDEDVCNCNKKPQKKLSKKTKREKVNPDKCKCIESMCEPVNPLKSKENVFSHSKKSDKCPCKKTLCKDFLEAEICKCNEDICNQILEACKCEEDLCDQLKKPEKCNCKKNLCKIILTKVPECEELKCEPIVKSVCDRNESCIKMPLAEERPCNKKSTCATQVAQKCCEDAGTSFKTVKMCCDNNGKFDIKPGTIRYVNMDDENFCGAREKKCVMKCRDKKRPKKEARCHFELPVLYFSDAKESAPTSGASMTSISSIRSNEYDKTDTTRTETTVYSVTTTKETPKRKNRVQVTTKANRSTETERKQLCNISTVTSDWWSPVLEKKKNAMSLVKKRSDPKITQQSQVTPKKRFRNQGVITEGRVVTFKSGTQVIPPQSLKHRNDIMSPSRYLLESQKYYNELFAPNLPTTYGADSISVNTFQHDDSIYSSHKKVSSNPRSYRNRKPKTKRLEESYAPKKVSTPRQQKPEQVLLNETAHKRLLSSGGKKYRSGTNASRRSRKPRKHYTKPILVVKRGHVDLFTREVLKDDLTMDSKECSDLTQL